jgi:peptide chain release factor 1
MKIQLDKILAHHQELTQMLADPDTTSDQKRFRALSKEFAEINPIAESARKLKDIRQQLQDNRELLEDPECEPELKEMAQEELPGLTEEEKKLEKRLQLMLLPKDPNDERNVILEVRAGTGGEEAALFAADLFRMYTRYAEKKGYKVEILSSNRTGIHGYKEIIAQISGHGAYSRYKFESGVHRVQRIPLTETQGRIHTSACTVAVLPEADEVDIDIHPDDLRIDVFRSSGPGGQSVNTTDSAVRITHVPTGIVVSCQDEKSQHKNKAKALKVLQARLYDAAQRQAQAERAELRRGMVGSGDRSERIRTYNFPQGRITDHRINLSLYKLEEILAGEMDELVEALLTHHQAKMLAAENS